MFKVGYSNKPSSEYVGDGLKLIDAYLTTALKCVPPQDKPNSLELQNCFSFFKEKLKSFQILE